MEDITVEELKTKIDNKEQFIFIDVREFDERARFNLGGTLVPIGQFNNFIDELSGHKEEEIVLYCRSGMRSGAAKEMLLHAGFKKPRNLIGGVLAWIEMNRAV